MYIVRNITTRTRQ